MKLGPVTKLDKKNRTTSKKMTITSYRKIVMSWPFFQFTANLEQSGSHILDPLSVNLILQKLKTELKNLEHSSHTIGLRIPPRLEEI